MWFGYISCFFYKNSFETCLQAEALLAAAKSENIHEEVIRQATIIGAAISITDVFSPDLCSLWILQLKY